MSQAEQIMVQITTLFGCTIVMFIMAFWYRSKVVRMVVKEGRVLVEGITAIGTSWKKLIKPEGDMLIVKRNKNTSLFYNITHENTYQSSYPEGWCPGFFQAPCRKVTIDEESGEPVSNRVSRINLSPLRFANMLREQWTSMGADRSVDEAEAMGRVQPRRQSGGKAWVWILVVLIMVILGVVMYYGYNEWNTYKVSQGISMILRSGVIYG